MRRFIADVIDGQAVIDAEIRHHARVIRLEKGEAVELITKSGKIYRATVASTEPLDFSVEPEALDYTRELPYELWFAAPLLKGDKFDFLLQKATELGVTKIIPYLSSRTVVRLSQSDFGRKKERYSKIIAEAVEQSNRDRIPEMTPLCRLTDIATLNFDRGFVAYEEKSLGSSVLPLAYAPAPGSTVVAVIGPEGGFSKEEIALLNEAGFEIISLGRRILKAETAACFLLSVLVYKGEAK